MGLDQDDGAGGELRRPLHRLADVDRGVVDGAGLLHLVGHQPVLLVEKQNAELFLAKSLDLWHHALVPQIIAIVRCICVRFY